MTKKSWIIILIIAAIILGWWLVKQRSGMPKNVILFSRTGCPHCIIVEEFLQKNPQLEKKINLEKKVLDNNSANVELVLKAAKKCGIDSESVGLPFLWTGKTCILGSVEVINFFNAQKK